ncbi:MAG: hypothetical protein H5T86_07880 [Armatimonadetes bacterium]|nr:hypothetical protein [Armatimonadota bacterium]
MKGETLSGVAWVLAVATAWAVLCAPARADMPPPPPFFLLYDMNRDGKVNYADIGKFGEYWKAYHANGKYEAVADLNGDGKINYYDAMTLVEGVLAAMRSNTQSASVRGGKAVVEAGRLPSTSVRAMALSGLIGSAPLKPRSSTPAEKERTNE